LFRLEVDEDGQSGSDHQWQVHSEIEQFPSLPMRFPRQPGPEDLPYGGKKRQWFLALSPHCDALRKRKLLTCCTQKTESFNASCQLCKKNAWYEINYFGQLIMLNHWNQISYVYRYPLKFCFTLRKAINLLVGICETLFVEIVFWSQRICLYSLKLNRTFKCLHNNFSRENMSVCKAPRSDKSTLQCRFYAITQILNSVFKEYSAFIT